MNIPGCTVLPRASSPGTGQQDWVVGLEPGINIPEGRVDARKHGRLATLNLGQTRGIHLEIVVLRDREDIDRLAAGV